MKQMLAVLIAWQVWVGHDIGRVTGVHPLCFLKPTLFSPHLFGNPLPIALDQVSEGDISLFPVLLTLEVWVADWTMLEFIQSPWQVKYSW